MGENDEGDKKMEDHAPSIRNRQPEKEEADRDLRCCESDEDLDPVYVIVFEVLLEGGWGKGTLMLAKPIGQLNHGYAHSDGVSELRRRTSWSATV